jgi:hypothetical protein
MRGNSTEDETRRVAMLRPAAEAARESTQVVAIMVADFDCAVQTELILTKLVHYELLMLQICAKIKRITALLVFLSSVSCDLTTAVIAQRKGMRVSTRTNSAVIRQLRLVT